MLLIKLDEIFRMVKAIYIFLVAMAIFHYILFMAWWKITEDRWKGK